MKNWLLDNFLPMWAQETVLRDNKALKQANRQLWQEIGELRAYIRGLERGLRAVRKEGKHGNL